jgi:hypothetical protein
LISVPFQLNFDRDIGPVEDGTRWQLNFQPVVPMSLNVDWNVISRTILPVIEQEDIASGEAPRNLTARASSHEELSAIRHVQFARPPFGTRFPGRWRCCDP